MVNDNFRFRAILTQRCDIIYVTHQTLECHVTDWDTELTRPAVG
jgi:hypothetical protein